MDTKAARIQELEAAGFRCVRAVEEYQAAVRNIVQQIEALKREPTGEENGVPGSGSVAEELERTTS